MQSSEKSRSENVTLNPNPCSHLAAHQLEAAGDVGDLGSVHDVHDGDMLGEGQVWQQLGGEQEALRGVGPAGRLHELHEGFRA